MIPGGHGPRGPGDPPRVLSRLESAILNKPRFEVYTIEPDADTDEEETDALDAEQ